MFLMKKGKLFIGFISIVALLATACSSAPASENSNATPEEVDPAPTPTPELEEDKTIKLGVVTSLSSSPTIKEVDIEYNDSYLFKDTKTFNKKLSLFAFGSATSSGSKEELDSYLTQAGFETNYHSPDWEVDASKDTLAYAFSHKTIDNSEIIIVTVRGINYGKEFANNFFVEKEGNHAGFENGAQRVYEDLLKYLTKDFKDKDIRVLINGYSRGAAISNVLSSKLLSTNNGFINDTNLYCYSFETPRGLTKENAINYKNVFNIVSKSDVVTYVAPSEINLFRCGEDIDIFDDKVSKLIEAFDENSHVKDFQESEGAKNDKEYIQGLIKKITNSFDGATAEEKRVSYVEKYQSTIMYAFDLFASLSSSTISKIQEELPSHFFDLFDKDKFYELVKHYVDEDGGFEYKPDELKTHTNIVHSFLLETLGLETLTGLIANGERLISMHYPETVYCLLNNYQR